MSLLLLGAFLIKTSVFICVPLFGFLLVNDWLRGKNKPFWLISALLLVFFFLLHGFWYKETFGDFWFRFNNISNNHEATDKTFFDKTGKDILKRLTYLPFLGFAIGVFFIPLLFGLPALLTLKKKDWGLNDPNKVWAVATVIIIGSWWFISTNWKYYSPMPTDTRHITFVIPVLIMAGAHWWLSKDIFQKLLQSQIKWAIVLGLVAIPIYRITKANDRAFSSLEEMVQERFVNDKQPQRVITDGLLSYGYPYFYAFEKTEDQYDWWVELDFETVNTGDYLLVNSGVINSRYEEPGYLKLLENSMNTKGLELVLIDEQDKIRLYQIRGGR